MSIRLFAGYAPHRHQAAMHGSGARFLAMAAGARGGKTHAAAREFMRRIYRDRKKKEGPLHYWAVSPSYPIGKTQLRAVMEILGGPARDLIVQYRATEHELKLAGSILIEFKSGERPESLVGVGLDGMWIDESARLKADAWLGQLRMRLSDKQGWCVFSSTPLGRNWFFSEIVCRADKDDPLYDPDYDAYVWTTADNTSVPGLAEEMERARRTLPPKYFRREYEARFETFTDQVFEEWDRKIHVADPPAPNFADVIAGVDWGFRNPGAVVVVGIDGDGGRWALDEIVEDRIAVKRAGAGRTWTFIARELCEKYGVKRFFADPSRPDHIRSFRQSGLKTHPAKNDVAAGIENMAILLHPDEETGLPRLFVSPRCRVLIHEMDNYRYEEGEGESPVKQDDHAVDALRYALSGSRHVPAAY